MTESCDCEGVLAKPVVMLNVGILASVDILPAYQASADLIYAMNEANHHDLVECIETRHGLRHLSYRKKLGMGNDRYILIDADTGERITPKEAVAHVVPFKDDAER